jgi:hypothetical protein
MERFGRPVRCRSDTSILVLLVALGYICLADASDATTTHTADLAEGRAEKAERNGMMHPPFSLLQFHHLTFMLAAFLMHCMSDTSRPVRARVHAGGRASMCARAHVRARLRLPA